MLKNTLLLLFLFIISQPAFADAMPKGYQKYHFATGVTVDSILIQESDDANFSSFDTLKTYRRFYYTYCENNECRLVGHRYKQFQRLVLFTGGRQLYSAVYEPTGSNPAFEVNLQNGTYVVTETTPFLFRGTTGEILRALIITLLLELLTALTMLNKWISKRNIGFIALANCISLPVAWLLCDAIAPYTGSPFILILLLEVVIVVFEYLFLKYFIRELPAARLLSFTLVANVFSFLAGGILYIITSFL